MRLGDLDGSGYDGSLFLHAARLKDECAEDIDGESSQTHEFEKTGSGQERPGPNCVFLIGQDFASNTKRASGGDESQGGKH